MSTFSSPTGGPNAPFIPINPTGIDANQALTTLAGNSRANMDRAAAERTAAAERGENRNQFMAKMAADREKTAREAAEREKDRIHEAEIARAGREADEASQTREMTFTTAENEKARNQQRMLEEERFRREEAVRLQERQEADKRFVEARQAIERRRMQLDQRALDALPPDPEFIGPEGPGQAPQAVERGVNTDRAKLRADQKKLANNQRTLEVYQNIAGALETSRGEMVSRIVEAYSDQLDAESGHTEAFQGKVISAVMGMSMQMAVGAEGGGGFLKSLGGIFGDQVETYGEAMDPTYLQGAGKNPSTVVSAMGEERPRTESNMRDRQQAYFDSVKKDPARLARYMTENIVASAKGGPRMEPAQVSEVTDILMAAVDPKMSQDGTFKNRLNAYLQKGDPNGFTVQQIGVLLDTLEDFGDPASTAYSAIRGSQELEEVGATGVRRGKASMGALDKQFEEGLKVLTGAKTNAMKALTTDPRDADGQTVWSQMTNGGMSPEQFRGAVSDFMKEAFTAGTPMDKEKVLEFVNTQAGMGGPGAYRLVEDLMTSDEFFNEIIANPEYMEALSPEVLAILEGDTGDTLSVGAFGKQVLGEKNRIDKETSDLETMIAESMGAAERRSERARKYEDDRNRLDDLEAELFMGRAGR